MGRCGLKRVAKNRQFHVTDLLVNTDLGLLCEIPCLVGVEREALFSCTQRDARDLLLQVVC